MSMQPSSVLTPLPAWVVVRLEYDYDDVLQVGVKAVTRLSQLRHHSPSGDVRVPVAAVWCRPEDFERLTELKVGAFYHPVRAATVLGRMQLPREFHRIVQRLYGERPDEVRWALREWRDAVVEASGAEAS